MGDNLYFLIVVGMLGIFLLVLLMILLQIKNKNKILFQRQQIAEGEMRHQKDLMRTFINSQEQERRRIGMDLHDEVGTALSSLRMLFVQTENGSVQEENRSMQEGNGEVQDDNAEEKRIIDKIIKDVRNISHNLSPFLKGAYELREALEDITERITGSGHIHATLDFNGAGDFEFLSEEAKLSLFRILSELINNTVKHAAATALDIGFRKESVLLKILYSDNGTGMRVAEGRGKGMGMMNIESRLSMLGAVWSIGGKGEAGSAIGIGSIGHGNIGFCMQIDIPLNNDHG